MPRSGGWRIDRLAGFPIQSFAGRFRIPRKAVGYVMSVSVHPTCVTSPGAELGEGTEVGPSAVIENGVVAGQRCRIGSHAVIREFTRMASDNQVFEHAVIGGTPQDFDYNGARSSVRIGR